MLPFLQFPWWKSITGFQTDRQLFPLILHISSHTWFKHYFKRTQYSNYAKPLNTEQKSIGIVGQLFDKTFMTRWFQLRILCGFFGPLNLSLSLITFGFFRFWKAQEVLNLKIRTKTANEKGEEPFKKRWQTISRGMQCRTYNTKNVIPSICFMGPVI